MRILLTALLLSMLTACASSPYAGSEDLREGMDKDEVLNTAGNPKRTFRSNGQDHWIYVFFKGNEELSRQVSFEDGKVVKIGRAMAKQSWSKELESMKNDGGFTDIGGSSGSKKP
jgi:outer membrane protein assembly factor BamE (lipoprotein component of BamABCDE complex)